MGLFLGEKVYYRVSVVCYSGCKWFEVHSWRWWWPFWIEIGRCSTQEDAHQIIKGHSTYYDGAAEQVEFGGNELL